MNLAEMDYPLPDPLWDYYGAYLEAIALHSEATEMISRMSEEERRSAKADNAIRESLREISARVSALMALLD